ncbi:short chain dehydrogenase [Aeromonas dhakensis]|uniref:short chain dehydrogenase n=1 Tax=Aeromonas dhakensis TaxID=196024 RepID=UPI000373B0CB|nr:short chain dehydrogenase [Aeromonas dhakensis]CAB5710778.1 3-oxoacyl-[acyl-carrier-protein] reductase FabG [Aeromonas hydrophila]MBL0525755.1 short chain dehydrogenase [Aeromonas dhakensis]MBL0674530.1 short chain dehydrogenase [Aeromonas dhakensis]MDX7743474.1 short chain dehydrogenase [Aeromonas dhakensis]WAF98511.1 short chain dehydrogenase [Aeromonas dhakensis]
MKIVIVGASGTIGSAVSDLLAKDHQVIRVSHSQGDARVDMRDPASIRGLFAKLGQFDALVVASGSAAFNALTEMTDEEWQLGIQSKLMGQINLTRAAIPHLNDKGSITLISGILSEEPINWGASVTTINGAVEHFVKAAACELPRGLRINVVSPTVLAESMDKYASFFPGFVPVPAARVAQAYQRSVLGVQTGQVFRVNG